MIYSNEDKIKHFFHSIQDTPAQLFMSNINECWPVPPVHPSFLPITNPLPFFPLSLITPLYEHRIKIPRIKANDKERERG